MLVLFILLSLCADVMSDDKPSCTLNWLHAPRTIATFCLSIQHACNEHVFLRQASVSGETQMYHGCPRLKPLGSTYGNRYHKALNEHDIIHLASFVTVLRRPKERFVSNFCDGPQHHHGLSEDARLDLSVALGDITKLDNMTRWMEGMAHYAAQPYSRGCYVRMLTGSMCSDADVVVDESLTKQAIANLDQFLFVGVSESYPKVVDAFLRVAATALPHVDPSTFQVNQGKAQDEWAYRLQPAVRVEKTVIAEASHNVACEKLAHMMVNTGKVRYEDPFDQQVYDHAKELFATKFNVSPDSAGVVGAAVSSGTLR